MSHPTHRTIWNVACPGLLVLASTSCLIAGCASGSGGAGVQSTANREQFLGRGASEGWVAKRMISAWQAEMQVTFPGSVTKLDDFNDELAKALSRVVRGVVPKRGEREVGGELRFDSTQRLLEFRDDSDRPWTAQVQTRVTSIDQTSSSTRADVSLQIDIIFTKTNDPNFFSRVDDAWEVLQTAIDEALTKLHGTTSSRGVRFERL